LSLILAIIQAIAAVRRTWQTELSARDALELATLGGAALLNRDNIGAIAPGMAADFVGFRIDTPAFAGALHDPVAAFVLCATASVDFSVINGVPCVSGGQLVHVDVPVLIEQHNALSTQLLAG
jgi:8-oxoguanine deaminase